MPSGPLENIIMSTGTLAPLQEQEPTQEEETRGGFLINRNIAGLFGWFALPNPAKEQSTQLSSTPL